MNSIVSFVLGLIAFPVVVWAAVSIIGAYENWQFARRTYQQCPTCKTWALTKKDDQL